MTRQVTVKINGKLYPAQLPPGCYRVYPNGNVRGTAYLANGKAVRVSKHPKASYYKFHGLAK